MAFLLDHGSRQLVPLHSISAFPRDVETHAAEEGENKDEIIQFMIKLAKALHSYGTPAHRTEFNMTYVAQRFGIEGHFSVLPTMLFIVIGHPGSKDAQTILLKVLPGYHSEKLYLVNELAEQVITHKRTLAEGHAELDRIIAMPSRYKKWLQILCYGLCSGSISPLFFGGGFIDAATAFMLGIIVGLLSIVAEKSLRFDRLFEFAAAVIVSFLARISDHLWPEHICLTSLSLSAVVWLLPGLTLTLGVMELATRNMVSGTSRMFYAFMIALKLGFGIVLGLNLPFWWGPPPEQELCDGMVVWWNFLWFIIMAITFCLLFDAHWRQWPVMIGAAAVGYAVDYSISTWFNPSLSPMLASACVGVYSNAYAQITGRPAIVPALAGILPLVPGGMGVRGTAAFLSGQTLNGISLGFGMIIVALSITIGVFVGHFVVYPAKLLPDKVF